MAGNNGTNSSTPTPGTGQGGSVGQAAGAIAGMLGTLRELKSRGRIDEASAGITSFAERQRLVHMPFFNELQEKYSVKKS